jgi:hypothetical protein
MLIMDPYSLLPALTLAVILGLLLWPENITYKTRLRLFFVILLVWVGGSLFEMAGYGSADRQFVYFINLVVGCFGLVAVLATYHFKPSRDEKENRK